MLYSFTLHLTGEALSL